MLPTGKFFLFFALTLASIAPPAMAQQDDQLIERGKYLATAGDCIACHTVAGGKSFAGGLVLPTPVGNIVSTNITPSKTQGIGNYTLEDFSKAMRQGVAPGGRHLYPAMPYTAYALVSDDDIAAMYAYFMHKVEPVDTAAPQTRLPFPFNIRASMAAWNLLFLDKAAFQADPEKGDVWNRGAYLSRGLAHCATCHTPRNFLMDEDESRALGGAYVGPWLAPNITSDEHSGIGTWSTEEIVAYLKTGRVHGKAQAAGAMAEAIDNSLKHLTDNDLNAMAVYLKSVPAVRGQDQEKSAYAWGAPADELASIRGKPLPEDPNQMTGAQLYDAECASCHQAQGEGSRGLPSLFHNSGVGRLDTNNLVMVILDGIHRGPVNDASGTLMPGYRDTLSDTQIATLGTYLVQHFGNPDAKVTADQVAQLKTGAMAGPDLVRLARIAMAAGLAIVLLLIAALLTRRARRRRRSLRTV